MGATHRWRGPEILARIEANVEKSLDVSALIVQREIKMQLNRQKGPPASPPGSPPAKRTGGLGGSVQIERQKFRRRIGPNKVYARIHEFGGVILPRKGRWLWWKQGTEWRRATRVTLPRRPYMAPAAKAVRARVLAQFTPDKLLR